MTSETDDDVREIRALIARQFASISWTAGKHADWAAFAEDFLPEATLFPAARPVAPKSVAGFVERMKGVAANDLESLEEAVLGAQIQVFGNVAVAMAVAGLSENGADPSRAVEAMLLVRDDVRWRIAAQAWDVEGPGEGVPPELLDRDESGS